MLKKIVSGGQNGADQAGLFAAQAYGLQTGGYAPQRFRTLDGPVPKLLRDRFGLVEHSSWKYAPRTFANAALGDATIRLAVTFDSAGEKCTLNAIRASKTPHFDVDLNNPCSARKVADWLRENDVETLNVAGNSQGHGVDIFTLTQTFLSEVLEELGFIKQVVKEPKRRRLTL